MLSQENKKNWSDVDTTIYSEISNKANRHGQHKLACPVCQHTRSKHKRDKPLSVNID